MSNHLKNESSLYLRGHAKNPVNWYPWGNEALELAQEQNKPIFLSIGYSSCHWCDVMRNESFENKEIATILNDNFISVKIDKEERNDIDKYFQNVYSLMNGKSGGWPTSIFLTPNLKPFYSATYIPVVENYGLMAFGDLLDTISTKYNKESDILEQKGGEILTFLKPKIKLEATKLNIEIVNIFVRQSKSLFDHEHGGFGKAPKFPQVSTYLTLMECYKITKEKELLKMIEKSLVSMVKGGFYDSTDGGFYRYSPDEEWLIPHYEKMCYDNGLLTQLYLQAYELTKNDIFKDIAVQTIDFMVEHMRDDGLFYASRFIVDDNIHIDTKVITSWNSMMIKALFMASKIDDKYLRIAEESISQLISKVLIDNVLCHTTTKDTNLKISGFLEDYAYFSDALIEAYNTTNNRNYLEFAGDICNESILQFYKNRIWNYSNKDFTTKDDINDSSYPSSVSIIINSLMKLTKLGINNYTQMIFDTLEINSYTLMRQPISSPMLTLNAIAYLNENIQ